MLRATASSSKGWASESEFSGGRSECGTPPGALKRSGAVRWASVGPSSEQRTHFAAVTRLRTVPRTARSGVKDAARHSGSRSTPPNRRNARGFSKPRKDVAHGSKVGHRAGRKSEHHDRNGTVGEAGGWFGGGARR